MCSTCNTRVTREVIFHGKQHVTVKESANKETEVFTRDCYVTDRVLVSPQWELQGLQKPSISGNSKLLD